MTIHLNAPSRDVPDDVVMRRARRLAPALGVTLLLLLLLAGCGGITVDQQEEASGPTVAADEAEVPKRVNEPDRIADRPNQPLPREQARPTDIPVTPIKEVDPLEFFLLTEGSRVSTSDMDLEELRELVGTEIRVARKRFEELDSGTQEAMLDAMKDLEHGLTRDQLRLLMKLQCRSINVVCGLLLNELRERQMALLTKTERELVETIARKLRTEGFFALSRKEFDFAYTGPGREVLRLDLHIAANELGGSGEAEGASTFARGLAELLDLDENLRVQLAIDMRMAEGSSGMLDFLRVRQIATTLVRRDRELDESEVKFARGNPYLRQKLREYMAIGVDPETARASIRAEIERLAKSADECTAAIQNATETIGPQQMEADKLQQRLRRIRGTSTRSDEAKKRLEEQLSDVERELQKQRSIIKEKQRRRSHLMEQLHLLEDRLRRIEMESATR